VKKGAHEDALSLLGVSRRVESERERERERKSNRRTNKENVFFALSHTALTLSLSTPYSVEVKAHLSLVIFFSTASPF